VRVDDGGYVGAGTVDGGVRVDLEGRHDLALELPPREIHLDNVAGGHLDHAGDDLREAGPVRACDWIRKVSVPEMRALASPA
jgi:hypothetical protein